MLRELEHVTLNQLLIAIAKNVVKHKPAVEGKGKGKEDNGGSSGSRGGGGGSSQGPHER